MCFYYLDGLAIARNADEAAFATHGIHQQFQHLPQHVLIVGMACNQSLEAKLPGKIFLIQGAVIFSFGFCSGGHVRKERISLTRVSIILISLITSRFWGLQSRGLSGYRIVIFTVL